jgi:hypothetical protein
MTAEYEILKKIFLISHVIKNIWGEEEGQALVDRINDTINKTSLDVLEVVDEFCRQDSDLQPLLEFLENDNWRYAIGLPKDLIELAEKSALESIKDELETLL